MRVINKLFEIPEELSGGISKVTVIGFNRMLIENYMHIMEYQDIFIRIKMEDGLIDINGFNLELNEMTKDDLIVTGTIESVEFEKIDKK